MREHGLELGTLEESLPGVRSARAGNLGASMSVPTSTASANAR
jgi:hypothetical protein